METKTPSDLPEIDRIEIVDLRAIKAPQVDEYMENARNAPYWRVIGEEAQAIAKLWRGLPAGEQSRCHIPPFGFRFFCEDRLVAEASVCWLCNNVFGTADGIHVFFEFDSAQPVAQRLLFEAERISGISAQSLQARQ